MAKQERERTKTDELIDKSHKSPKDAVNLYLVLKIPELNARLHLLKSDQSPRETGAQEPPAQESNASQKKSKD